MLLSKMFLLLVGGLSFLALVLQIIHLLSYNHWRFGEGWGSGPRPGDLILFTVLFVIRILFWILIGRIYSELPHGALGGPDATAASYVAEEDSRARLVDFELDKNRSYPDIDKVEGFVI